MNNDATDEFLAHYGVVGMKWGKRSGGFKSRVKGAALDSLQRRRVTNEAIAGGNGKARDYFRAATQRGGQWNKYVSTAALLTTGSKSYAAMRATSLAGSEARIKAGKPKAKDVLQAAVNVNVYDLFVSRRDKREA